MSVDTTALTHERYGRYEDTPHAEVEMHSGEYHEGAKEALSFRLGPPIAWEYDDGTLYLWGENLTEDMLTAIADACHEVESEYKHDAIYGAADAARRAVSKVSRAEVEHVE